MLEYGILRGVASSFILFLMRKNTNFFSVFLFSLIAVGLFLATCLFFLKDGFLSGSDQVYSVPTPRIFMEKNGIDMAGQFECGKSEVRDADGNRYSTVYVEESDQCWMGENMNVGTFVVSTDMTENLFAHSDVSDNGIVEKYCYGNSSWNCRKYGGLYDWDEAMGYVMMEGTRGICPDGWHIPTDAEWHILESAFAEDACDTINSIDPDHTGELLWAEGCGPAGIELGKGGVSGLDLPYRGLRDYAGGFSGESKKWTTLEVSTIQPYGAYWSSSFVENGPITRGPLRPLLQDTDADNYDPYVFWKTGPIYRKFTNEYPFTSSNVDSRPNGFFVRCIRDIPSEPVREDEAIICGVSDPLSCEDDSDCICAGDGSQYHGCFSGNRAYYEKCEQKEIDCTDYCQGWGKPNIRCVEGRCSPL